MNDTPARGDRPSTTGRGTLSPTRFAAVLGSAMALGHLSQLVWLSAGSRAMSAAAFGTVLAAQALYGMLQYVVDNGPAFYGARLAAQGSLDDGSRASLVRLRLEASAFAAAVALTVGALGGADFLRAVVPFALALPLFALFGYWERFGVGDSGPWSAYTAARSAAPAAAALAVLAFGTTFPLPLAGILECGIVVAIALAFGLAPVTRLREAVRAPRGPWREPTRIGLPIIVAQIGLGSGTVLLGVTGNVTAAAILAVSIRLLTGLNQLSGLVSTSLFPRLARFATEESPADRRRGVTTGMTVVFVLTAVANAVLLAAPDTILRIFLSFSSPDAVSTAALTLAAAAAVGYLLVVTTVLIARHHEAVVLVAYLAATALILATGIAVVALEAGGDELAFAMAGAFAAGQVTGVILLVRRAARVLPDLATTVYAGAAGALGFVAAGAVAALADVHRPFVLLYAAIALALVARLVRARRRGALV